MKRFLVACLFTTALISCKKDLTDIVPVKEAAKGTTKKVASKLSGTEKIKLLKAGTLAAYYSRSYTREKTFYVEVANLAYNKQVFVYHKMSDGSWKEFPLSYVKLADNNTEIWSWELNYGLGTLAAQNFVSVGFSDEFALKYIVNGQTYWDNNNGRNYNISTPYKTDGLFLQDGINVSADTYKTYLLLSPSPANHSVQVQADVRNLAYNKQVTMVYSTNGWRTVQYQPLSYANTYAYGGDNLLVNRDLKNFEKWTASFSIPQGQGPTTLQYAISYKANGVEYWDNNYGRNYTIAIRTQ